MIALLIATLAWANPEGGALEAAYQKEFAYLKAEKEELLRRRQEQQAEAQQRVSGAEAELDRLQGRLVSLTRRADQAEDDFSARDRQTTAMDDASVSAWTVDRTRRGSSAVTACPNAAAPRDVPQEQVCVLVAREHRSAVYVRRKAIYVRTEEDGGNVNRPCAIAVDSYRATLSRSTT